MRIDEGPAFGYAPRPTPPTVSQQSNTNTKTINMLYCFFTRYNEGPALGRAPRPTPATIFATFQKQCHSRNNKHNFVLFFVRYNERPAFCYLAASHPCNVFRDNQIIEQKQYFVLLFACVTKGPLLVTSPRPTPATVFATIL